MLKHHSNSKSTANTRHTTSLSTKSKNSKPKLQQSKFKKQSKKHHKLSQFQFSTQPSQQSSPSSSSSQQVPKNNNIEQDDEPVLEIVSQSPSRSQTTPVTQTTKDKTLKTSAPTTPTPQMKKKFNIALAGEPIPPEGVIIFEHRLRGWLQSLPPATMLAAVGVPLLGIISSVLTGFSPEVVTLFGCASASTTIGSYFSFKFTQTHVNLVRLKQDNIIEFETAGFFGYKKFVTYPANYILPMNVDPQHGMFGYKVKFLPLIQDMQKDGQETPLHSFDSGLVIAPDVNCRTGNARDCWNALSSGSKPFGEVEQLKDKRRVANMV